MCEAALPIAKYIRLSIEDAKTESLSIENQRLELDRYIDAMDIPSTEVLEFVDNGYSGTNFERPAVQELLELVRQGRVNCIAIKDLSRFGRNMVDTGYYIECVFPLFRVRLIAISDDFDSAEHDGGTGGLEVAFKLLLHEQYSRDLSEKIRTAKRTKALRGEYVIKNCVFGFKKVNGRLEIDEPAAQTVRLIFEMYRDGYGQTEIAARLYKDKHPAPGEYRKRVDSPSCLWHIPQILNILRDEQYMGTYIAGKTKRVEFGSQKVVNVDKSEWIRIPDHHPAIVDKALFYAVQERFEQKKERVRKREAGTWQRYSSGDSVLKGKVACGCCGHSMRTNSAKNVTFFCQHTRVAPDAACHRFRILGCELEGIVLENIREQAQVILNSANDFSPSSECQTAQDTRIKQIEDARCALYERFVLKEVCANEFKAENEALNAELESTKHAKAAFKSEYEKSDTIDKVRTIASATLAATELTQSVVDGLIDKVCVYPNRRIEVAWKHSS